MENAKFCIECGTQLNFPKIIFCPNCKIQVNDNTKFCPKCGTRIIKEMDGV